MAKNIVVCCDGTANEVKGNLSNVLKVFRILKKDETQRVYYYPGIGTIPTDDPWAEVSQKMRSVFAMATAHGLDDEVLGAYRFIGEHYEPGDAIFLFGFSRGAYTVRALAGFIHTVGLLRQDQLNIADFALTAYKGSRADGRNSLEMAWYFGEVTGAKPVTIKFVGVWDSVASVIAPRHDRLVPTLQFLPYTLKNPSVEVFRHAMAIDERRRMFRLLRWQEPQPYVANRFDKHALPVAQNIKQVWFAGFHGDVGGGGKEETSGLSKYPLAWMIDEAVAHGLEINVVMRNHLVFGHVRPAARHNYVAPNAAAETHDPMNLGWRILELIPKRMKWDEWPRPHLFSWYIPNAEPRLIANDQVKPRIHQSVLERQKLLPAYRPVNLPAEFEVEPWKPLVPAEAERATPSPLAA